MRGDGSTLRILGPVELIGPGGPVRLGAAQERRLLAVLGLHLGEAVSQDRLAEALWGEHAPRSATNALQNYVLRLRRALQAADGVQIVTDPAGYRLEAPAACSPTPTRSPSDVGAGTNARDDQGRSRPTVGARRQDCGDSHRSRFGAVLRNRRGGR
jgi:DNA-binding winged helix-turn-helix (wHTH) protein